MGSAARATSSRSEACPAPKRGSEYRSARPPVEASSQRARRADRSSFGAAREEARDRAERRVVRAVARVAPRHQLIEAPVGLGRELLARQPQRRRPRHVLELRAPVARTLRTARAAHQEIRHLGGDAGLRVVFP